MIGLAGLLVLHGLLLFYAGQQLTIATDYFGPFILSGLIGLGFVGAAVLIGIGVGLITPIGFAHLAATTPTERLGQTMGSAEVGRELGDAGGPLLVGALAAATTLTPALLILAALLTTTAAIVAAPTKHPQHPTRGDSNV